MLTISQHLAETSALFNNNIVTLFLRHWKFRYSKSNLPTSDYDIPRTTSTSADGNYDVPRSSESVHSENADENFDKETDVRDDFAV